MGRKPTGNKNGRPYKWGLDLMKVGEVKCMEWTKVLVNGKIHHKVGWSHMSAVYKAQKRTGFEFQTNGSAQGLWVKRVK